jgi:hypothetical protein
MRCACGAGKKLWAAITFHQKARCEAPSEALDLFTGVCRAMLEILFLLNQSRFRYFFAPGNMLLNLFIRLGLAAGVAGEGLAGA